VTDWVKFCRDEADDTFYIPLKETWTKVGDRIQLLNEALDIALQYVPYVGRDMILEMLEDKPMSDTEARIAINKARKVLESK
jgi:hypothetical protein